MTTEKGGLVEYAIKEVLSEYGFDTEPRDKLRLVPGEEASIMIEQAFSREGDFGNYWVVRATDLRDGRKVYFTTAAKLNVAILERLVDIGLPVEVRVRGGKRSIIITY